MAADLHEIFQRGGKALVDLLEYCVRSMQTDIVFSFLVREYRIHPTAAKALALYEMFCAADAPARIAAPRAFPPYAMRIHAAVQPLLQNPTLPPKYLFDFIVAELEKGSESSFHNVGSHYDPGRDPWENLPGGKMNAGQRAFVEKVWEPTIRPRLVQAGFRRIADIG
jgi:hypothetical protein